LKQTNLNKRRFPINFEILLVQNYNLKIPIILCKTNFTFPSLFDNRNLFNCLSNHWNVKNNDDIIKNLISIINNIPNFINTYDNCVTNYQLLYIPGEFSMTYLYNVNDFLVNNDNHLYKFKTSYLPKEEFCYFIINDINYLFLVPSQFPGMKQWASIFFSGFIFEINNFEIIKKNEIKSNKEKQIEITFIIVYKTYIKNKTFSYSITLKEEYFKEIDLLIQEKNKKIDDKISMIIPNYIKEEEFKIEKSDMESMKILVSSIKKYYKQNKENNVFGELILKELYKFMSDLLKENGDEQGAKYYKNKIKKFEE
jgi:hypothetical protein